MPPHHTQRNVNRLNVRVRKPDNRVLIVRWVSRINQNLVGFLTGWKHPCSGFQRDALECRNPQHGLGIDGRCPDNFDAIAKIRDHLIAAGLGLDHRHVLPFPLGPGIEPVQADGTVRQVFNGYPHPRIGFGEFGVLLGRVERAVG
ncbi:hypothetical protein D3C81_960310 [compost metagenome]